MLPYFTDCVGITNAHWYLYNGQMRCIVVSSTLVTVDQDTERVEGCVEQYGSSATLLALPESDTELWDLVTDQWTST